jgi:hypothetical protein
VLRDLQLCLLANGGAELVDVETEVTLWASDTDEDFQEEFPELLDENDVAHLQDYLEDKEVCTDRELEAMDIITEPLGPDEEGDEDDDELDFNDDAEDSDWDEDGVTDGEVIEHGDD